MNCEYFSVCVCCSLTDVSVPRRVMLESNTCTKVFTISSEISEIGTQSVCQSKISEIGLYVS